MNLELNPDPMKNDEDMKYKGRTNRTFLIVGQLSFVLGILCTMLNSWYLDHFPVMDFMSGLFLGLSSVMNLAFLVRYSGYHHRETE